MNIASPWPTSRNVTCSRPSPRDANSVAGVNRIHAAAATATADESRRALRGNAGSWLATPANRLRHSAQQTAPAT